jgi:histidinol-phosphate aminotransferase
MSKSRGLAGLRVGFALGQPHLIEALVRIKDSFNSYPLGRLAQAGAIASMSAQDHFRLTCQLIVESRRTLAHGLTALGFAVLPSKANFLFAAHESISASELSSRLRDRAILVRHFNAPRIENHLRITVGTPEDNGKLLAVLAAVLSKEMH